MSHTVLLLGATGFVGGQILHKLITSPLSGPDSPSVGTVIALVSGASKAAAVRSWESSLRSRSTSTVLQIEDVDRSTPQHWYNAVEQWSANVDCVINAATSDDLDLTKAINAGIIKAKHNGRKATLVHLSGVQLIESQPVGTYVETPNYNDADAKQIQSIADSAAHRLIDLEIAKAISAGAFWGSIVCPALIWGISSGPCKRYSAMVPDMVRKSLHNKRATHVGDGTNRWIHVHIDECVDLILALVADHLSNPSGAGRDHALFGSFFFASHRDLVDFKTIARAIGRVLARRGIVETDEPISVPAPPFDAQQKGVRIEDGQRSQEDQETDRKTPIWPCRTNCRCIASRGPAELGWKCTRAYDDAAIEQDVEGALDLILAESST
ncbi:uncharacterized protein PFL1_04861 [Pseudozyma flocculosa PF-1]|uniref:NAD-dependent epimerase/dehydratase domain-containing protein n=2 Tax=Pseudozyma flocculosa TaxID=84751 RepID=A0A5C3F653_9BASI|nr:uncharacterized protein PFL1_04861 [Pseudozyma flocculosa PF-1]EPQ27724.1 hypothetical protein PFL1_04861 [Pseudozyma flocculosa PF-1]SPO39137.1 uncharacterized protein PSFLO_04616 [Pseudozyma flocculosa]